MGCLRILLRKSAGTSIVPFREPSDVSASDTPAPVSLPPSSTDIILSSDGALALSIEGDDCRAVVRSTATGAEVSHFGGTADTTAPGKVSAVAFSPSATAVLTWCRPAQAHLSQDAFPNLCVYRVADGVRVAAWHQKLFDREKWPYVQWSDDETVAARLTKAEISFYDTTGPEAAPPAIGKPPYARQRVAGAGAFRLAPTGKHVAAFVPAGASSPGRLMIFAVPTPIREGDAPSADDGSGGAQSATEPLASRSTFKADAVEYSWNSPGTALLATTSTNIDTSGKSYYGESALYYATLKGEPRIERMVLPKEGPVFAANWNAQGNSFVVVYGSTPARATLFTAAAKPVFDYGTGPRNTALFAPLVASRRLVLAGFGNLPGGVEVWDKVAAARVGAFDTNCATAYGWAPDGRYFLAATTFPRLRVDNGYAIYRYDGSVVERVAFPEGQFLLQATFVPTLQADLPPRPKSPDRAVAAAAAGGKPSAPAAAVSRSVPAVEAYRPPGMRGRAPAFKLHETVEAGKVTGGVFGGGGGGGEGGDGTKSQTIGFVRPKRVIAGLAEEDMPTPGGMTKSQRKNAKKKEKAAREKAAGGTAAAPTKTNGAAAAPTKTNGAAARGAATAKAPPPPPPTLATLDVESLATVEDVQKKLRGVAKKLRAVDSLAADQAAGKVLNAEQVVKLGMAGALRDQLAALETRLAALST
ncbi:hypothetical protein MMPV_004087 [Pyropia vietnamensis]